MGIMPFTPMGNTVTFTADTVAPTPVQAASTTVGGTQYRIHNNGTAVIYLGFGPNAATATSMANVTPNGSTISMVAGSVEVFTLNANQYFTAMTSSGNSVVYITPGDGA
jgi:hypothetical protein